MLTLLADENMPLVDEFFGEFCWIERKNGREICHQDLADVDILLVRSITQVNRDLLENTPVKFVGTATIGTDHVDTGYLRTAEIQFADAAGCNAQAVAEYVLTAIAYWGHQHNADLNGITVGIIGAGNVGTKVSNLLKTVGIKYLLNDPILENEGDKRDFVSIDEIKQCHIVTCHVPLTKDCEHETYHLLDKGFLQALPTGSLLINSSRGAVLDNQAALESFQYRDDLDFVLDVWEGEPNINLDLLQKSLIGTPHIAGYSIEGKIRGTFMLYRQLRNWLDKEALISLSSKLPKGASWQAPKHLADLHNSLVPYYDIKEDDASLKTVADNSGQSIGDDFDKLRKNYKNRLEFYRSDS